VSIPKAAREHLAGQSGGKKRHQTTKGGNDKGEPWEELKGKGDLEIFEEANVN